jgi:2-(1,2-epoxy-1,2-dihydrophenyl)acetyl-CoA isomerase
LQKVDKPVVAAIHGPAVGAGMSIALACDLRVASEDATFSQAFVRIGLSPDGGSTWLLPRLVGPSRAAQLMMSGETLGARRAYEWGLINQLAPEGEHLTSTLELSAHLAALSSHALGSIKRLMRSSERSSFQDQLEAEAVEQGANSATPQFRAALDAFLKRK